MAARDKRNGALEQYRDKRDFELTPEPGPDVKSSPGGNLFIIQKHASRRLHYDVRLEMDGVLKSWAVPKGPSLDPADKHLAVHVEDHPLDYADFEGVIPKGEYGGGTVMVWDKGTWYPEEDSREDPMGSYREGHLKFRLEGTKLHGRWMLVRMKPKPGHEDEKENWLLFKERDDKARQGDEAAITRRAPDSAKSGRSLEQIAADADAVWTDGGEQRPHGGEAQADGNRHALQTTGGGARGGAGARPDRAGRKSGAAALDPASLPEARPGPLPERVEPELATLVPAAPEGDGWLHEVKLDGYRVLCRLEGGDATLYTRRGADWTSHFPTLLGTVERVPAKTALLDGEVVYVRPDGRTSFPLLASALQSGTDPDERIVYFVFDLLYLDGIDLMRAPLERRKELLRGLLSGFRPDDRVRYVGHIEGRGVQFFEQACKLSLEGSIAKRRDAPYRPGRGRDWLKVKCMQRQEFVVGGFTDRENHTDGVGALLVGYHEEVAGPLHYAGRVGTGWDDRTMHELRGRLDERRIDEPAFVDAPRGRAVQGVHWVRPDLVVEVEYLTWSGRDMLRHPSFEGLRLDKPADEVVAEHADPGALKPFAVPTTPTAPGQTTTRGATVEKPARNDGGTVRRSHSERDDPDDKKRAKKSGKAKAARPAQPPASRPIRSGSREGAITVGGVTITNPDRVMYPESGITKGQVAAYYDEIAPWILPHIAHRPLTLVRCPEGYTTQCFFQKHHKEGLPGSVLQVPIPEGAGTGRQTEIYLAVDSTEGLLSLVQMSVLEFHVWGSHLETLEYPDQIVFDLDPDPDLPFSRVVGAARLMHDLLQGLGLRSFVKTTGGKGLHIVAPVRPVRGWDEVKAFARGLTQAVVKAEPERYTANMALKKRPGKIFVDYLRNGRGATYVTAYSTRRRPGAPVSTPLRWDELPRFRPGRYTLTSIRRRLASLEEDPWEGFTDVRQEVTPAMLRSAGVQPAA